MFEVAIPLSLRGDGPAQEVNMRVSQIRPCPLCVSPVVRWQLKGGLGYNRITCPHCGTFAVEPTLPPHAWMGLPPEDALLVAFLPAYIRDQNRRHRVPLLTPENWRALARRGRFVAVSGATFQHTPCGGRHGTRLRSRRR
jgi:hypothetical protein